MAEVNRHGWLTIPDFQTGERTLKEQMLGLDVALSEAKGKSVLDVGCAEGLIGLEFARAGASRVLGVDRLDTHIRVARKHCGSLVKFQVMDLNEQPVAEEPDFDIVLALAVLHKLVQPAHGVRYCASHARSLVVVRLPYGSRGRIQGKHSGVECDVPAEMAAQGFRLERKKRGPRHELVQYYRRRV